jgi:catechol 2,3-dioxygenase-like lactoylglutathione lyase family enzyme
MSLRFGAMRQLGYVVRDMRAALRYWTETMQVGPFFLIDVAPVLEFTYMGRPSDARISIALAQSGPMQVELIQPLDDRPSMYRDFLGARHEGLHHLAYWSRDFDIDMDRYRAAGFVVGQSGQTGGPDGRFVYFTAEQHPGTVVELSEISGPKGEFFERIAAAAADWDGQNPVRPATVPAR